jgi:hypothetical protein
VELPRILEWDYVRVPVVPTQREYHRPRMTGPYSWIDAAGHEVTLNPEAGNIAVRKDFPAMGIDDLPDPDAPVTVDPSALEAVRQVVAAPRFREFIVPGLARQCQACHDRGGYFIKHTDGNVWSVLDTFVELGIDGWHGIQPDIGMDLRRLKERYGEALCLFGGVNCATLIERTSAQVREEVRYAIQHAGPGGGLVIATSNVVQPGTKLQNYRAMRQAVRDFGEYPIRPG